MRNGRWHLVPKENSLAQFRTTIDLRPVNAATFGITWPMPNIDSELQDFEGSEFFAVIHFLSGYWQLPVDPDSYGACGVVTPIGVYSSTRVLHGLKNGSAHFQSHVEPLFSELRGSMKAWVDDFNLHEKTERNLLKSIERFLEICEQHNLFVSAKKSIFFARRIKWCGRIIDKHGYSYDPRNVKGLKSMTAPSTAAKLSQFIHCCRWMSTAIPDFNIRIAPLNNLLEENYLKAGKRNKYAVKNIGLDDLGLSLIHI